MPEQEERLRDAFAQLLAQGQRGAVPAEALWARQGLDQLPRAVQPPPPEVGPGDPRVQGYVTPMPQQQYPAEMGMNFPTAPAGPRAPDPPPRQALNLPFKGKGEVIGPYGMPKSPKKNNKKKGKD